MVLDIWAITAAILMIISVALSLYSVCGHLCNFTKPYLQRYVVRILLMVPIYSMNAWFAMILPEAGPYLDTSREVYESFVIYSFMKYLLNFLQHDTNLQQYIDHKPGPKNIFPLCCLPACVGGKSFMVLCKHGILQYVVVRPLTTLIAFISQLFDFYGEGNYNPLSGYTYPVLLLINNASQVTAMYCLVIFYVGYRQELAPMKPLAKFFSIKLVVFFSFFQYVVISGLLEIHAVEKFFENLFPELNDKVSIGRKLQEFLICIDMLIAAFGHVFAFPHKPFTEDEETTPLSGSPTASRRSSSRSSSRLTKKGRSCFAAFAHLFDFSDERSDIGEHFGHIFDRVKSIFSFRAPLPAVVSTRTGSEPTLASTWVVATSDGQQQGGAGRSDTTLPVRPDVAPINGPNLETPVRSYSSLE